MKKSASALLAAFTLAAITFAGPPVGAQSSVLTHQGPPNPPIHCSGEIASECPPPAACFRLLPQSPLDFARCVSAKFIHWG